jgi:hypothetical protein
MGISRKIKLRIKAMTVERKGKSKENTQTKRQRLSVRVEKEIKGETC